MGVSIKGKDESLGVLAGRLGFSGVGLRRGSWLSSLDFIKGGLMATLGLDDGLISPLLGGFVRRAGLLRFGGGSGLSLSRGSGLSLVISLSVCKESNFRTDFRLLGVYHCLLWFIQYLLCVSVHCQITQ